MNVRKKEKKTVKSTGISIAISNDLVHMRKVSTPQFCYLRDTQCSCKGFRYFSQYCFSRRKEL